MTCLTARQSSIGTQTRLEQLQARCHSLLDEKKSSSKRLNDLESSNRQLQAQLDQSRSDFVKLNQDMSILRSHMDVQKVSMQATTKVLLEQLSVAMAMKANQVQEQERVNIMWEHGRAVANMLESHSHGIHQLLHNYTSDNEGEGIMQAIRTSMINGEMDQDCCDVPDQVCDAVVECQRKLVEDIKKARPLAYALVNTHFLLHSRRNPHT